MLKVLLSVFLVLFSLVPLHSDNMQKLYTVRDAVYRRTDALCRRNGAVGPSSFSPMPARALEIALERLDPAELNESDRAEWLELMSQVSERDVVFSYREMSLDVSLDFNIQANAADYALFDYSNRKEEGYGRDMRNEALVPYRYEKPFGTIRLDLFFGHYVALEGELFLGNNNHHMYETSLGWLLTRYDGKIYTAASPSEEGSDLSFTTMSMDIPHRAGISAGNDYISFAAGRFPHSAGSGVTGNLVAGDNFSYQEIAALSFMNRYFTYNISVTRFDREENTGPYSFAFSRNKFQGNQQFRVLHRFDVSIADRARIVLDLGTVFNSSTAFDLRFFYPFMINHNLSDYTNQLEKQPFDEANNILSLSAEGILIKGLSLSAQFVLDQARTFLENGSDVPAAWGALVNVKYSTAAGNGFLDVFFEAVYTNPYLYLNGKREADGSIDFNLDYVSGYFSRWVSDFGCSGYVFGPDSIVFALQWDYRSRSDRFSFGGRLMYRVHGSKVIRYRAAEIDRTEIDMSSSIITDADGNESAPSGGWKNAEQLVSLAMWSGYSFSEHIRLDIAAGGGLYFNYDRTGQTRFVPQLAVSMKISAL